MAESDMAPEPKFGDDLVMKINRENEGLNIPPVAPAARSAGEPKFGDDLVMKINRENEGLNMPPVDWLQRVAQSRKDLVAAIEAYAEVVHMPGLRKDQLIDDANKNPSLSIGERKEQTQAWQKKTEAAEEYLALHATRVAEDNGNPDKLQKKLAEVPGDIKEIANGNLSAAQIGDAKDRIITTSTRALDTELVAKNAADAYTVVLTEAQVRQITAIHQRNDGNRKHTTIDFQDGTHRVVMAGQGEKIFLAQDMGNGKMTSRAEIKEGNAMAAVTEVKEKATRIVQALANKAAHEGKTLAFIYDANGQKTGTTTIEDNGKLSGKHEAGTLIVFRGNDNQKVEKRVATDGLSLVDNTPATAIASGRAVPSAPAKEGEIIGHIQGTNIKVKMINEKTWRVDAGAIGNGAGIMVYEGRFKGAPDVAIKVDNGFVKGDKVAAPSTPVATANNGPRAGM